jgi:hypothetical protein
MYAPTARQRVAKHIRTTMNTSVAMQSKNRGRQVFSVLRGPLRESNSEARSCRNTEEYKELVVRRR